MGNKLWDVGEKTEKSGACEGPGLRRKWRLKALTGQSGEPGMHGKGIDKERCWYWIVLDALIYVAMSLERKTLNQPAKEL